MVGVLGPNFGYPGLTPVWALADEDSAVFKLAWASENFFENLTFAEIPLSPLGWVLSFGDNTSDLAPMWTHVVATRPM